MTSNANIRRRPGLGRGLGALIIDTSTAADETPPVDTADSNAAPVTTNGVQQCAIDAIQPNPHQPRTHFREETLQELAISIQTHGIIQPLIVTAAPQQAGAYWLVAGERRWRAARLAGLASVPVVVREASAQQLVELALIENIQRADLNPLEEAAAYFTLLQEFGLTHGAIAAFASLSRETVTRIIKRLEKAGDLEARPHRDIILKPAFYEGKQPRA